MTRVVLAAELVRAIRGLVDLANSTAKYLSSQHWFVRLPRLTTELIVTTERERISH